MSSDRFIPQQKFETPLTFDRAPDPPRLGASRGHGDHEPRSARYTEAMGSHLSAVTFSMVRR
jgi:hypothetical protein